MTRQALPRRLCAFLLVLSFISACAPPAGAPPSATAGSPPAALSVFAAASLADAFEEMGQNFEAAHPGVDVAFNFAGSQVLRTQLEEGAQAAIFASANQKEMDAAVAAGLVDSGAVRLFATNELVVILPLGAAPGVQSLEDLARPGLKLVLAAEAVPVGAYTRDALAKMESGFGVGFKDRVLANVVSEEDNVRQVVAKVQLGEADAGIAYRSDAAATPVLETLAIPPEFNVIAQYPIAPLAGAPHPGLAASFVSYVLSPDGQAVLEKWGFTPAKDS